NGVKEDLESYMHVIAALLFQKFSFSPGNRQHIKESCKAVSYEFYPSRKCVRLIALIKAAQWSRIPQAIYCDDRDFVADIANHIYGLSWDEFENAWSRQLQEFQFFYGNRLGALLFRKKSKMRLRALLAQTRFGRIFKTSQ